MKLRIGAAWVEKLRPDTWTPPLPNRVLLSGERGSFMTKVLRKRAAPLGGERLLPPELGDALAVLRIEARRQLLNAIADECPHVLDSLWREVFEPHFAPQGYDGMDFSEVLKIETWANRFNLDRPRTRPPAGERDWINEAAWSTLWGWKVVRQRPHRLAFRFGELDARIEKLIGPRRAVGRDYSLDAVVVPGRFRHKEEPYRSWLEKGYIPIRGYRKFSAGYEGPLRDEDYETVFVPAKTVQFSFAFDAFEPFQERTSDWKKRCTEAFRAALAKHLVKRDAHTGKTQRRVEPDHFRWAALYLCGERGNDKYGMTLEQVRQRVGRLGHWTTIQYGVQTVLNLVNLSVSNRRGRKPGVLEQGPRHIARK
jgi:hypothetical protein